MADAWTPLAVHAIGESKFARAHPVRFWSAPDPQVLVVSADGEGTDGWAKRIGDAGLPLALVGVASAGLTWPKGTKLDTVQYDLKADPRARAYLSFVDRRYFAGHMAYVLDEVVPWTRERLPADVPRLAFGVSNGAAWAAAAGARRPDLFAGVAAFSLAYAPKRLRRDGPGPHALVAGTLEQGFHRVTTAYARRLERRGVPVRLRTPERGHEHEMWEAEFRPALEWLLGHVS
jgi:Putative esterase